MVEEVGEAGHPEAYPAQASRAVACHPEAEPGVAVCLRAVLLEVVTGHRPLPVPHRGVGVEGHRVHLVAVNLVLIVAEEEEA